MNDATPALFERLSELPADTRVMLMTVSGARLTGYLVVNDTNGVLMLYDKPAHVADDLHGRTVIDSRHLVAFRIEQ